MVIIPTAIAIMSSGLLLWSGYVASAGEMKGNQSVSRKPGLTVYRITSEEGKQAGVQTIRGEVLRVEHENYFVRQYDGREVQLQIDEMTQMTGNIGQGEQIEAKVNEQNHAVSIRSTQATRDRRKAKQ